MEAESASTVNELIAKLREALAAEKPDAEEVRKLSGDVQQASLKAFDVAYKKVRKDGSSAD